MKITKARLRQIIKEEIEKSKLQPNAPEEDPRDIIDDEQNKLDQIYEHGYELEEEEKCEEIK